MITGKNMCGIIILTGPSSCGKGEVAKALSKRLSIPSDRHLSMGSILRTTISRARSDSCFREILADHYAISNKIAIDDPVASNDELVAKVIKYKKEVQNFYSHKTFISQLDWLEFCVVNGLLIPDHWTVNLINAKFEEDQEHQDALYILDGYPRTVKAAEALLRVTEDLGIPILSVIHLSISKDEMMRRALARKREDDDINSLERRYEFYLKHVKASIAYLAEKLGEDKVTIVNAHQPVIENNQFDLEASVSAVVSDVIKAIHLVNT